MTFNPYAPPSTSDPVDSPSRRTGSEETGTLWSGAGKLWPVYVITLLRSTASYSFDRQSTRLLRRMQTGQQATVVGGLLGVVIGSLFSDGRFARAMLACVLFAVAITMVAASFSGDDLSRLALLTAVVRFGGRAAHVFETGYVLRAVTVRGSYLSSLALSLLYNAGGMVGSILGGFTTRLLPSGMTLLAALAVVRVAAPSTVTCPDTVPDPLATEPVSAGMAAGLIMLLAAATALSDTMQQQATWQLMVHSTLDWFGRARVFIVLSALIAGLIMSILAFVGSWRPRLLVLVGLTVVLVSAAVVLGGEWVGSSSYVTAFSGATLSIGNELFVIGLYTLLRQRVPVSQISLWYGGTRFFAMLFFILVGLLPSHWNGDDALLVTYVMIPLATLILLGLVGSTSRKRAQNLEHRQKSS